MRRCMLVSALSAMILLLGCQSDAPVGYDSAFQDAPEAGALSKPVPVRYQFLLNSARTDPAALSSSPAVARAANGDMILIFGGGELTTGTKTVAGTGNYIHTDAAGNVLTQGTWQALQLLGFSSYGGEEGLPDSWVGGELTIRVWLSGWWRHAVVTAVCSMGDCPSRAVEGVTISVQGGLKFKEPVEGEPLFILD